MKLRENRIRSWLNYTFFSPKSPSKKELIANITMALSINDFESFQEAFTEMRKLAQESQEIKDYLFQLHNKITGGATHRIFKNGELPLDSLRITEANYQRYLNKQKDNVFEETLAQTSNQDFSQ